MHERYCKCRNGILSAKMAQCINGTRNLDWFVFRLVILCESCWTLNVVPYNVSVWTQSLVPFCYDLSKVRLESCKAERTHKIGNSLGLLSHPTFLEFQVFQVPQRVRIKQFDPYVFWSLEVAKLPLWSFILRSLFDLVLSVLFWTSYVYYAIV